MEDFVDPLRGLIAIGLAGLFAMLRLEAERFGTAEYYEATRDGERPRAQRRLAWYGLGFGIAVLLLYVHPSPQTELFLGSGDRLGAVIGGLAYGALGIGQAVAFATFRYHRIRFPDTWSYPGACSIRRRRRSSTRSPSVVRSSDSCCRPGSTRPRRTSSRRCCTR